jgi:hypothetical protein|eukprot:COSAG06_NODE_498_length_15000_cov_60.875721_8_plen_49_part_00
MRVLAGGGRTRVAAAGALVRASYAQQTVVAVRGFNFQVHVVAVRVAMS